MAHVPYNSGVPEVEPDKRAPDDYQHINVNPDQFGAAIGRGLEKAGQGAEQASTNLFNIAEFQGRINTDDQTNHYISEHDKLVYGDPSKPATGPDGQPILGPDGKPQPDRGFLGLTGRAPADQRQALLDRLEKLREDGRDNLKSPREKLEYDMQTRRMYSDTVRRVGAHAEQQWTAWAGGVNKSGADLSMAAYLRNLDNPEEMKHHASDFINFKVQEAQTTFGNDPKVVADTVQTAKRQLLAGQVMQIGANDPARATRILEQNKDIAGPLYPQLADHLRQRTIVENGDKGAARAAAKAGDDARVMPANVPGQPAQRGALTPERVHDAIVGQESGHNPNVPDSIDGAAGIGQIMPATFQQYAHPGEDIRNPTDNYNVSQRIIADYYRRYNGDASRVAVAYFSGPGNVAPEGSPTPYIRDAADGNGKRTSAYIADVNARLDGTMPRSGPAAVKANAYRYLMADDTLTAQEKDHGIQRLNRDFTAAQIAAEADERAKKQASDEAAAKYTTRMMQGDMKNIVNEIAADQTLNWQTKHALWGMAEAHSKNDLDGVARTYGPGFWDAYRRVTAPTSDPDRIADPAEVYRLGGSDGPKNITVAGADHLVGILGRVQKSVNDANVHQTVSSLLAGAKKMLSFESPEMEMVKIHDPAGERIFNMQFVPAFLHGLDDWTKAGKDPYEYATSERVQKMAEEMRPKRQMQLDQLKAMGAANPDEAAKNVPLPPAPEGVDSKAWNGVIGKPPLMSTGAVATPDLYGKAIQVLAKYQDRPEFVSEFNRVFGEKGRMAQDVLGSLKIGKPGAAPERLQGEIEGPASVAPQAPTPAPAATPAAPSPAQTGAYFGGAPQMTPQQLQEAQAQEEQFRARGRQAISAAAAQIGVQPDVPNLTTATPQEYIAHRRSALDSEEQGLRDTLETLKKREAGGVHVGMHRAQIEEKIRLIDKQREALGK